jgi:hypothetical protein
MRSPALVAALVVFLAAGCGQESSGPRGQETDTGSPPASTEPMPDPPVMTGATRLECANPTVMQVDHVSDVGGNPDPVKAARAQLGKQIRSDDVVERAESASGKPLVRVKRDGELVAIVHLMSADRGWLVDQVEMCPDFR